jgi:quinoprotein glucose dehydrogenase
VDKYRAEQNKIANDSKGDKLAPYFDALEGGDAEKGRAIFLNNSAVYCQRCHKLDGQGGDVGPLLNGLAADKEKDRRYLLESVVMPNAKIAKGYDTVILLLDDETTVSGIVKSEDKKQIKLVTPENKEIVIPVESVARRRAGPSAMPDDLHKKLSRSELREPAASCRRFAFGGHDNAGHDLRSRSRTAYSRRTRQFGCETTR